MMLSLVWGVTHCFFVLDIETVNQMTKKRGLAADNHLVASDIVPVDAHDEI